LAKAAIEFLALVTSTGNDAPCIYATFMPLLLLRPIPLPFVVRHDSELPARVLMTLSGHHSRRY
jgi:hypothetical protein